jgi:Uncharacterized protein conserved in bacteria (DUF2125)
MLWMSFVYEGPKPFMHRRWITRIAVLAVGLALLDWLGCHLLLQRMQTEYAQWQLAAETQGWRVTSAPVEGGGFPLGATLKISELTLSGGQALVPGGLDWHAQRVTLSLSLLHPWRLDVAPQGQQTVRAASGQTVVLNADILLAQVPLGGGRPDHIHVEIADLTAGIGGSGHPQDVRIDGLDMQLEAARGGFARTSLQLDVQAHGLGLPDKGRWPLGATVSRLEAQISLASPALSGRAPAEQARAWRDWGGKVEVTKLALKWGPLDMSGSATLGLDDKLQPVGHGLAEVRGWQATLDALASGGTLPQGVAQTAKAVLSLMAPAADGDAAEGGPKLSLPVSLKDNTVSLGTIPLLRVRPLVWGGV